LTCSLHIGDVMAESNASTPATPPPPLPERPAAQQRWQSYYKPPELARYPSYAAEGLYGGSGYRRTSLIPPWESGGYSGYGAAPPPSSNFVQFAEGRTQPAFDTILNVVQGFNSVSNMLESTYHALHSSFRATLQVAEQLSKVRKYLSQVLSALITAKAVRSLLGLARRPTDGLVDAWEEDRGRAESPSEEGGVSWPLLAYAGLVLVGPYLIWKFGSSGSSSSTADGDSGDQSWATGQGEHVVATAKHSFNAEAADELSVRAGQELRVAPQSLQPRVRGWLLAAKDGDRSADVGLVPANRVQLIGRRLANTRDDAQPDLVQR